MKTIKNELIQARLAKTSAVKLTSSEKKNILFTIADRLIANKDAIVAENKKDLDRMNIDDARYDRLVLNTERIVGLANSLRDVSELEDPAGKVLTYKELANGLKIAKKTAPLGVVGVIYESRPNVTVDVAALCIQSSNVCLLRGGSDAWYTNSFLVGLIRDVLQDLNLDPNMVQLLPTGRELVLDLLTATDFVDIIIPRGSQSLIDYVRNHARVPVIETGAGVCHTYIEKSADLDMGAAIVANAKISRPSVCNALDTVLLDKEVVADFIPKLLPYFTSHNVEIFADAEAFTVLSGFGYPYLQLAEPSDFGREFLDFKCSIKVVNGFDEALEHIATFSSKHSECIVSSNEEQIISFMNFVDAAVVYANASTRFTDGGEFGLGAEIGISTQKLHARGPFALEKLVTEKWFVIGSGQVR